MEDSNEGHFPIANKPIFSFNVFQNGSGTFIVLLVSSVAVQEFVAFITIA